MNCSICDSKGNAKHYWTQGAQGQCEQVAACPACEASNDLARLEHHWNPAMVEGALCGTCGDYRTDGSHAVCGG